MPINENHLESLSRAHLHLMTVVTDMDWPPDGTLVEALANVTSFIRKNDPDFEIVELIGRRVYLDGAQLPHGVILGWDFDAGVDDAYHVYSFNTGEVEAYVLGKNARLYE